MKSLLGQLPAIVAGGKRRAERALAACPSIALPEHANHLILGDNLAVMASLLTAGAMRGKIDLVTIDPPFDSNADYHAYSDIWADGTRSYLKMLTPRLYLMKELLADTGSIYVHLDWHVGHYVKIILDEIFGRENFRNDIIWHYENKLGTGWAAKTFDCRHDILFLYAGGRNFVHNPVSQPVRNRKPQPVTQKIGGQRVWLRNDDGTLMYAQGAAERPVGDVWNIPIINPVAGERLDYKTQKPEALLERIITASSREGQLVADFFAGSGTAAAVAERLGRRWIAVDSSTEACRVARERLNRLPAKTQFLFSRHPVDPVERLQTALGRRLQPGELAGHVLAMYGATGLPPETNPSGNLGRVGGTLVVVHTSARPPGAATLRRALRLREESGWKKLVVLVWNASPTLAGEVAALGQGDRLEVLVIPPDFPDFSGPKRRRTVPDVKNFASVLPAAPEGDVFRKGSTYPP